MPESPRGWLPTTGTGTFGAVVMHALEVWQNDRHVKHAQNRCCPSLPGRGVGCLFKHDFRKVEHLMTTNYAGQLKQYFRFVEQMRHGYKSLHNYHYGTIKMINISNEKCPLSSTIPKESPQGRIGCAYPLLAGLCGNAAWQHPTTSGARGLSAVLSPTVHCRSILSGNR